MKYELNAMILLLHRYTRVDIKYFESKQGTLEY